MPYENHHEMINAQNQNQIYEMIMGDVNGNKTTVLERADTLLKDNRLVPEGFVSTAPMYDTVKIAGGAVNDPDFNKFPGNIEGSGWDYVHFHIPIAGFPSTFNVFSRLYYQTLPPSWLAEMFSYSSAPIDSFKTMYNSAGKNPILVDADSLTNILLALVKNKNEIAVVVAPDPTSDGNTEIIFSRPTDVSLIRVLNISGQVVSTIRGSNKAERVPVHLPEEKGTYILDIYIDNTRISRKVIRY
jgi:hypothetical protein